MGQGRKDLSAAYIEQAVEASLKRLQIDVIDLYLSHWPDTSVPYDETLGAYEKLLERARSAMPAPPISTPASLTAALKVACAEVAAALRGAAAGIQSLRPLQLRRAAARPLHQGGDRRHHLFQPGQGVSHRQIPQRGRSRQKPARRRRRRISQRRAACASLPRSTPSRRGIRPSRPKWRWPGSSRGPASPRRSPAPRRCAQVDSLIRAASLKLSAADIAELDAASAP